MDGTKFMSRLLNWGTPLLVAGALVCFLSVRLTERVPEDRRQTANLLVKLAGLALTVLGALRMLEYI